VRSSLVSPGYYKIRARRCGRHGWHHTVTSAFWMRGLPVHRRPRKGHIISGGFNVYSVEVENVLLRHPDVQDVAVVASR